MTLRHLTPIVNLPLILSRGIDPNQSQCARAEIWMCSPSRTRWAVLHVSKRHRVRHVAIIELNVSRRWLTRRRKGIWTCQRTIPTQRMRLLEVQ